MKKNKISQKISEQSEKNFLMNIKIDKIVESINNHLHQLETIKEKKSSKS